MADSDACRWGRFYAGLHTLRVLAGEDGKLDAARDDAAKRPLTVFGDRMVKAYRHLGKAKRRGPAHADAAAEVFRALADFHPAAETPPATLGEAQQTEFLRGYGTQKLEYELAHRKLLT
ncbi:hypothetical protein ACFFKE_00455 [Streptomyces mutabilis]|uniref:hypothetical protein n=1 Tax=Streptomyces mutabilis TaxID=67332 RepID=UPI001782D581|nr:hypothetical protein [Streptomyces mutabilis]